VNRSIWVIMVLGFLTVVVMVVAMLATLRSFGDSPASNATKLALGIRSEFHFEAVGTAVRMDGIKNYLSISYETHADSKFDQAAQTREMDKVAAFAFSKVDPTERKNLDEIRIRRSEVHGRGCFQQSYVAAHVVPIPGRSGGPPSPFKPQ